MTAQPEAARLEVVGLGHRFGGNLVLDDLSLRVRAGELVALIGPNGAGKSSCFAAIGGQLRPDRGRILLDGADITALAPERRARAGLARCFQTGSVFASMSARENVQTALSAAHGSFWRPWRPAADCAVAEAGALLDELGIADLAGRAAGSLPPPAIRRLEIAVALAARPRLLLLDEPTAGLASADRAGLAALIRRLVRPGGMAVLFVEHDFDMVAAIADQVVALDRGARLAAGTPGEVRADPAVRAAYFGEAANRIDGR